MCPPFLDKLLVAIAAGQGPLYAFLRVGAGGAGAPGAGVSGRRSAAACPSRTAPRPPGARRRRGLARVPRQARPREPRASAVGRASAGGGPVVACVAWIRGVHPRSPRSRRSSPDSNLLGAPARRSRAWMRPRHPSECLIRRPSDAAEVGHSDPRARSGRYDWSRAQPTHQQPPPQRPRRRART